MRIRNRNYITHIHTHLITYCQYHNAKTDCVYNNNIYTSHVAHHTTIYNIIQHINICSTGRRSASSASAFISSGGADAGCHRCVIPIYTCVIRVHAHMCIIHVQSLPRALLYGNWRHAGNKIWHFGRWLVVVGTILCARVPTLCTHFTQCTPREVCTR